MRKCMTDEFNSIYIYHLQRTSGERSRQEGGKVFGEGSRAPAAIVFLIKNPESTDHGKIYFHAVDDYLTREEKLAALKKDRSIAYTPMNVIVPDAHGDWFNQRDDSFSKFIQVGAKTPTELSLFKKPIVGVCTNRDAWVYNSSIFQIEKNLSRSVNAYLKARKIIRDSSKKEIKDRIEDAREAVNGEISWSRGLLQKIAKQKLISPFESKKVILSVYRPFTKQYLYYDHEAFVEMPGKWAIVFPNNKTKNLIICSSGVDNLVICINQNAKDAGQISLMTNYITDLHFNGDTQCFPRWLPGEQPKTAVGELFGDQNQMPSGFSPEALPHFQAAYPDQSITEDDLFYYIYGILHSEDYRTRYANNLMKELPRIPRVATHEQFMAFG